MAQARERDRGAVADRGPAILGRKNKCPPGRPGVLQAGDRFPAIEQERAALDRFAPGAFAREFACSKNLHAPLAHGQDAAQKARLAKRRDRFSTADEEADGRALRIEVAAVHPGEEFFAGHDLGQTPVGGGLIDHAQGRVPARKERQPHLGFAPGIGFA